MSFGICLIHIKNVKIEVNICYFIEKSKTYCGDLLLMTSDLSVNALILSSSFTKSILCINIKMLASGEFCSIASKIPSNKVISFSKSPESTSKT
jgi:hypothetical protein